HPPRCTCRARPNCRGAARAMEHATRIRSLRTLASTGDGGPEDAPEELASGSP
ncbi:hypothetical protein BHE74_00017290, partial [Ensete ventricosum]